MSGIALVAGRPNGEQVVARMLAAAPHRGAAGPVVAGRAGFAGAQNGDGPAFVRAGAAASGGVAVAASGSLFAHDAAVVSGEEAARLVLERFAAGGVRALRALRGGFAIAVFDGDATVLVRSAGGERPLFFAEWDGAVVAASEVKQIRAALPDLRVDAGEVLAHAASTDRLGPATIVAGVRRVEHGSMVTLRRGRAPLVERLWDPGVAFRPEAIGPREAAEELRLLLRRAVVRRLDGRAALMLSAGVDSNAVAWAAAPLFRERFGRDMLAATMALPGVEGGDEASVAALSAAALGLAHVPVDARARYFTAIAREAAIQDGPPTNAAIAGMARFVDALRSTHGVRALVDGTDGDSVFGLPVGLVPALARRGRFDVLARHVSASRARFGGSAAGTLRRYVLPQMLRAAPRLDAAVRVLRGSRGARTVAIPDWVEDPLRERIASSATLPSSFEEMRVRAFARSAPNLIEQLERAGAGRGIAFLHPLADWDVLAFAARLPVETLVSRGLPKSLPRVACDTIPAEIRWRATKWRYGVLLSADEQRDDMLQAIRDAPRRLPGVRWDEVERRVAKDGVSEPEAMLLWRLLGADEWLR